MLHKLCFYFSCDLDLERSRSQGKINFNGKITKIGCSNHASIVLEVFSSHVNIPVIFSSSNIFFKFYTSSKFHQNIGIKYN